jgi:ketosteroid isomerase-like protein
VASAKQIAVAQEFFGKSFHGDVAVAVEHLAPDVSYIVPGSNQISGVFDGPEAVAKHVGELLRLTHNRVEVLQWEDWMEGVNHLGALVHMRLQRDGQIASFRSIYLLTMTEDDKIRRIEIFFGDQSAVDRFFSWSPV